MASTGWAARFESVYVEDPLHPANRWFQRVFGGRDQDGVPLRAAPDLPYPPEFPINAVDRAEVLALIDALRREGLRGASGRSGERAALSRFILHSDLVEQGLRYERRGELELALASAIAAEEVWPAQEEVPEPVLPAWFRERTWVDTAVRPRLRLAATPEGNWRPTEHASELWTLERTADGIRPRVFRFDRAAWLRGEDPWRELSEREEIWIEDPRDPDGALLQGELRPLCLSCHPPAAPFRSHSIRIRSEISL
jgi:hypothetical protein